MGEIVRLQKYIAMCGAASRRSAENMIADGRVKVNGKTIDVQGEKVEIGADTVELDGEVIKPAADRVYIMLNKPAGYVTTVKDQFDRPTVMELVETDLHRRVFPVGRLDYDTEGLLILSDDGDFAYRITHPKFKKDKKYIVTLKGGITIGALSALRRGVVLDDGFRTSPAQVEMIDAENGKTVIEITIHEGRNRQVRRMFEAVGCKVANLRRVSIANVELGNLPSGRWRYLTAHEVKCLKNM